MTPDEQAFVDRIEGAILTLEVRRPSMQRLRQIPMDMVAVAVMRQLSKSGVQQPFDDQDVREALLDIASRNGVATTIATPDVF